MAEENMNSLVTKEKIESNGYSSGKAFRGKLSLPGNVSLIPENHSTSSDSCHDGYNPRRNSTGKPSSKTSNERVVPNYLRASTGSCHDFCKYGKKNSFEEHEIRPWRKGISKAQSSKQNPAIVVHSEERKKATGLKQTASPRSTENPSVTVPWGDKKKATAPCGERKKATVVKEMTLRPVTQNPAATASLGEMKATVLKQMTSPDRAQKPAVTATLDERKKTTVLKQMASPDRTQNLSLTAPLDERKKAMVCKQMASPVRGQNPEMAVPSWEKKKAVVRKASSDRERSPAMAVGEEKKAVARKQLASPDREQSPAMTVSSREKKKATVKQLTSPVRTSVSLKHKASPAAIKSEDHPETIKKEVFLPPKKIESPSKDSPPHKNSKVEKRMNKIPTKHSRGVWPLMKQVSSFQSLASARKTEKAEKTMKSVSPKSSPSVVQQAAMPKSSLPIRTSEGLFVSGKRREITVTSKNRVVAKASAKKVLVLPIASIASSAPNIRRIKALKVKKIRSSKPVSSLVDQSSIQKTVMGKAENENVPERTLHVIVTESESSLSESTADNKVTPPLLSQPFLSPKSSKWKSPSLPSQEDGETEEEEGGGFESEEVKEEIDYSDGVDEEEDEDEVEDEDDDEDEDEDGYYYEEEVDEVLPVKKGMANDNNIKAVEGNERKTLWKRGSVISESKDLTPVKVKFRRGRVVDLQTENSNAPRRLRFRQRRVTDEKHSHGHGVSEIRRRNFKKKVADGDGDNNVPPNPSNEKVVLRHQDMQQGKKDEQGLFNNVIEETASKLVESRKSKVKALVGAFETVISLQDIKPSSATAS